MWLLWLFFKLLGAGIGILIGVSGKKKPGIEERLYQDKCCFVSYSKHKGSITGRSVGVKLVGPKFRLVRESKWDTRFKDWGLSSEVQTGDDEFDELVYVVSDNVLLGTHLSMSQETRDAIREILSGEYKEIECDGEKVWLTARGGSEASDTDFKRIVGLGEKLEGMKTDRVPLYREPFFVKASITETILYALSGYAWVGFMELLTAREDLIVHTSKHIWMGLGLGVALFAVLISVVRTFFQGSSRGHRIILESAFLLFFSLPLAGIILIEDVNIGFDQKPEIRMVSKVSNVTSVRHTTKNGHYYTYHAYFSSPNSGEVKLPEELSVPNHIYRDRAGHKDLELTLGRGALGLPWVKGVRWKAN